MEKYYCRKLFNISDALELLKNGYVLTRAAWQDETKSVIMVTNKELSDYLMYDDGYDDPDEHVLLLVADEQKYIFCWHPSVSDLLAEDWYVLGREDEYGVVINEESAT